MIPTTLGDNDPLEVLPVRVKNVIDQTDVFIVENEKTARRFIKKISPNKSQPDLKIFLLNKHTEASELPTFLSPCLDGINVGLLSEAGVPGIADPGAGVVKIAHEKNLRIIPLVGPSSIVLAMMSSGLNGQNFAFNGYLPIQQKERRTEIKRLERLSSDQNQSQIFIETPYRNTKMFEELCATLSGSTQLCIACDITLTTEFIRTLSISQWQKEKVDLHKRPAIFIIQL